MPRSFGFCLLPCSKPRVCQGFARFILTQVCDVGITVVPITAQRGEVTRPRPHGMRQGRDWMRTGRLVGARLGSARGGFAHSHPGPGPVPSALPSSRPWPPPVLCTGLVTLRVCAAAAAPHLPGIRRLFPPGPVSPVSTLVLRDAGHRPASGPLHVHFPLPELPAPSSL